MGSRVGVGHIDRGTERSKEDAEQALRPRLLMKDRTRSAHGSITGTPGAQTHSPTACVCVSVWAHA